MGWKVVHEYDAHPLADDSEDEKRLYRAESRANRKAKAEKAKRRPVRRYNPYRPAATVTSQSLQQADEGAGSRKAGLCFLCHKPGHWKNTCELAKGAVSSNNKLSMPRIDSNCLLASGSQDEKIVNINISGVSETDVSPVGRLKAAENKWQEAGANAYIMRVITEGYSIPFRELPGAKHLKNNKSARDNMNFVKTEVSKLLQKGCVSEVFEKPKVVNPLTVAFSKTGKERLVLDCRHINEFLIQYKFKYEDINVAMQMFEKGYYLFSYDLKGAYHHIMIKSEMRTYLGFSVDYDGVDRFFVYNVAPFGLATSGFIFSKVLRVLVAYWRGQGHKVIMFLDDGIGGHPNYEMAVKLSQYIKVSLTEFGFLLANEKCNWTPVLRQIWLGYLLDMTCGKVYVTGERIARLEAAIESCLYQMQVSGSGLMKVRFLASIVGQIISLQTVVGKLVSLRTRALYECILSRASWNAPVFVTKEAIEELVYWQMHAKVLNKAGRSIKENLNCDVEVFCDASADAYGGYFEVKVSGEHINEGFENGINTAMRAKNALCCGNDTTVSYVTCDDGESSLAHTVGSMENMPTETGGYIDQNEIIGSWSKSEASRSSTWREAEAVRRVLVSKAAAFKGKKLKVFSDNMNVKSILSKGSRKPDLQRIALNVNEFCSQREITLIPEWIPRDENQRADHLSRCFDCDDWEVTDSVFQSLDKQWGPHSVDRFSADYNNKLPRFNSRWWVPGTEAVNAFDQPWSSECNWMVPPPRLISLCLDKLQVDRAPGTLVVPEWKSAPYWVKLVDSRGNFVSFIAQAEVLPFQNLIKKGRGNNGVFGKPILPFRMLGLKIRFE